MLKKTELENGLIVLKLAAPRLTAQNAPAFREKTSQIVAEGQTRIILDLSQVEFVDSTGLGAIVGLFKQIGNRGDLAICGLNGPVLQMFKLTRMDRVFRIFADPAEAAAALELA